MMRRYLVLALLCLMIVSGCNTSDNPYNNLDYRTGTEGIVVNFAQDSPPAKVYKDSYLNLVLEVRNKGAFYNAPGNAKVYLSGFDPSAIHFKDYNTKGKYAVMAVPEIIGKNAYMADGGYELVDFKEDAKVNVPFGDTYTPTLMATSCYNYQTLATPSVCVVSDPIAITKDNVCKPEPISMTSQGAPVAVTKVEEEVMQQSLNFIITVENVGGGKVFSQGAMGRCPFEFLHDDMDLVSVGVTMSNAGTVECTPSTNMIRLVNNKGVIFCRVPVELHTSYVTPLAITLYYGYTSSVTRTVTIANPPGTGTSYGTSSSTGLGNAGGGTGTTQQAGDAIIHIFVNNYDVYNEYQKTHNFPTIKLQSSTNTARISGDNIAYCTVGGPVKDTSERFQDCNGAVTITGAGTFTVTGYDITDKPVASFIVHLT